MAVGTELVAPGSDWRHLGAHLRQAIRAAVRENVADEAAALAYYVFLAIPAALLLALGLFGIFAGEGAVDVVVRRAATIMPAEAVSLIDTGLTRAAANTSGSIALVAAGLVVALWTATGAMTALMRALNRIHGCPETRGFVRQRLVALAMLAVTFTAFALVVLLLVLGGPLSDWIGSAAGLESPVQWIWWTAQWPILIGGLLAAFAGVMALGPNIRFRRRLLTPGAAVAVVLWLLLSGLFAAYAGSFGSYDKTWGTLAGVVVTLVWIWLSALALLVGAELDARARRASEAAPNAL